MSYEAWRTGYQSDEQAGRAAYNAWKRAVAEGDAMAAAAKVSVDIGLEVEAEFQVTRAKLEAAEAHIAALLAELDARDAKEVQS